jgi:hypothetical protein
MKMHLRNCLFYALSVFLFVVTGIGLAQLPKLPKPPIDIIDKMPSLDRILKSEPPISTSIKDAKTGIPFLDRFDPADYTPMNALPQNDKGAFHLLYPGLYALDVESYCLRAGTYAPTKGDGHLYAPLKGQHADIVQHVVQKSYSHSEIPQRDIQVLLWAIIARTKLSDMSQKMQMIAAKLLSPKEMFELNGGALEIVPKSERDKAFAKVPAQVRQILEAEAQLREQLTQGQDDYEELENIAVRFGAAPIGEGSREIPRGQWSYHPDGYFIRMMPRGYKVTEIHLYVPEKFTIKRDDAGRITLLADNRGNRIEVEYDDTVGLLTFRGDPHVRGYVFGSVRFVQRRVVLPEVAFDLEATWDNAGWTLVGVPSPEDMLLVITEVGTRDRYTRPSSRYEWAKKHKEYLQSLDKLLKPKDEMNDIMDIAHITLALEELMSRTPTQGRAWAPGHVGLAYRAWQYAFTERQGMYVWGCAVPSEHREGWLRDILHALESLLHGFAFALPGGGDKIPWFDPAGGPAAPGNTSGQRIEPSGRQKGNKQDCNALNKELKEEQRLLEAFEDSELQRKAMDEDWSVDEYYDKVKENALGGKGSSPGDWESPMGTDPTNCEIQYNWGGSADATLQEYIKIFGSVAGPLLFRAHQAHEQTHRQQCMDMGPSRFQSAGATIEGFSGFEQEAYKKGIEEKKKGKQEAGCE